LIDRLPLRRVPLALAASLAGLSVVAPLSAQTIRFERLGAIPGAAEIVRVQGRHAYLAHSGTLTIVDLSNPAVPKRTGAYTFPDKIWGVKVVDTLVYAAVDKYGLGIVDVSNPSAPVLRGQVKTPGQAKSVALVSSTALVADHMAGVNFVDVSNTAKPVVKGSFFLDGYARAVASSGTIAAAVDAPKGLYVFDLSNPSQTEPSGVLQSAERPGTIEILEPTSAGAPRIAVLVGGGLLQLYDITKPASPAKLADFATPSGRPQRVALKGTLAYVADASGGLQVVDLTRPSAPRVIASHKTSGVARDVAVAESLVLLAVTETLAAEPSAAAGEVIVLRQVS
jgi:hypothetical protein